MANPSGSPVPLIGRILISQVFVLSGINFIMNFAVMEAIVKSGGLPLSPVATAGAAAIELLGGLAVLFGFQTRVAAWILFLFLIPTTLIFHNFWAVAGPDRIAQLINFQKNLAIMGGLLVLAAYGAGGYSIDNRNAAGG
jgi:putative oxidoreductase